MLKVSIPLTLVHADAEAAQQKKVPLSLLRLTLYTGLKHQLRVHLAHSLHSMCLRFRSFSEVNNIIYSTRPR